jgi:hypothetical protein
MILKMLFISKLNIANFFLIIVIKLKDIFVFFLIDLNNLEFFLRNIVHLKNV